MCYKVIEKQISTVLLVGKAMKSIVLGCISNVGICTNVATGVQLVPDTCVCKSFTLQLQVPSSKLDRVSKNTMQF